MKLPRIEHAKAVNNNGSFKGKIREKDKSGFVFNFYSGIDSWLLFLISSLILFLQSGCSTSMMKASPFYTGEIVYGVSSSGKMLKWNDPEAAGIKKTTLNQDAKHFDDDRVNVWPIFYKNFLLSSIIWPIGEINDVGWEIRPLVSIDNYNESYHAMAYLWGYNGKSGSSYLFPAYYMDQKSMISLLGGWGENFTYIIPPLFINFQNKVPGKSDEKENIYIVLWPLAGFNTTKDESFVLPVYLDIDKGFYSLLYGYGEKFLYFLPPCYVMIKHPEGNSYNIIWPLCSLTPSKNNYYSFPLFHYSDDQANGDFEFNYLFPLGWSWDERNLSGSAFIPLYFEKTTKASGEKTFMTPLFGWFNGGKDYYVTPFFIRNKYNERTDYEIMFPLGRLRVMDKKEEGINQVQGHAFPFCSYYEDKSGYDLSIMFPFVARGKRIIGGSKEAGSGKMEYQRYLPFYYDYSDSEYSHTNYAFWGKSEKSINGTVKNASYLLPFYYSRWDTAFRYELDTTPPVKTENTDRNAAAQNRKYKKITSARKSTFIMPDILFSENIDSGECDFSLVPFYFYNKNKNMISESTFFWLYTRHENTEKKNVDAQALWYLYYYSHQDKSETEQERTSARILWKLYHRECLTDETNLDIFPFISYSENQKRSRFSFCWHLFNYEKTAESFKLHLFFIPVMW
jgi:hypothetical protein